MSHATIQYSIWESRLELPFKWQPQTRLMDFFPHTSSISFMGPRRPPRPSDVRLSAFLSVSNNSHLRGNLGGCSCPYVSLRNEIRGNVIAWRFPVDDAEVSTLMAQSSGLGWDGFLKMKAYLSTLLENLYLIYSFGELLSQRLLPPTTVNKWGGYRKAEWSH